MRRPLTLLVAGLFSLSAVSAAFLIDNSPASAAPIAGAPITLCADPDTDPLIHTTQGGGMIKCTVQITNTVTAIDPISGVASGTAVIYVEECTGPANGRLDPNDLICSEDTAVLTELVTHVDQCNGVGNGGGAVLECNVDVITNFVGVTPEAISSATVNQCVGSAPVTTGCDPFPATTTNATITQCNGSSDGGTQEDFNCIASGTTTASLSVTVYQCNGSNRGGGSWLNCSAELTNNLVPLAPTDAPTAAPTDAPTAAPTTAPTTAPTAAPAATATAAPTGAPTTAPTAAPAATPTGAPTAAPAATATAAPTTAPTAAPAAVPTPTFALPDTGTPIQPAPGQGGPGLPLLIVLAAALFSLPLWKIYTARGLKVQ